MKSKKLPKIKKGAWFYKIRGSYLPANAKGWLMHAVLVLGAVDIFWSGYYDTRSLSVVLLTVVLELIGLGAVFTFIASKKS